MLRCRRWVKLAAWMTVAALIVIGTLYFKARASAYSKSLAFSVRGLNMRLSWIALKSYATEFNHGRLPPTTYVTTSGEPLYSWRMKFMLNVEGIGDGANYDKPWTSPENHQFADAGAHAFSDSPTHDAKILAVIGEGAALNARESRLLRDVPPHTIVLVEVANSGVHWMEPKDLEVETMSFRVNDESRPSIRSHHEKGAAVIYGDLDHGWLDLVASPDQVKNMVMITKGIISRNAP